MNGNEIKKHIDSLNKECVVNKFALIREITQHIADNEEKGKDLLLRLLEKREYFSEYEQIIEDLIRSLGLFPYNSYEKLGIRDKIAYEFHRPIMKENNTFVFHREQSLIFRRIMDGDNIILSAPTSFGKSRIIDEIASSRKFKNIAIIVPTIALIDETRRRFEKQTYYKLITHSNQEFSEAFNLCVVTPERFLAYKNRPYFDFFVIDEFYKINDFSNTTDHSRTVALNKTFYILQKEGGQFYMLGPNIQCLSEGIEEALNCHFVKSDYSTVAHDVYEWYEGDEVERLLKIIEIEQNSILVFCKSPDKVISLAKALMSHLQKMDKEAAIGIADWLKINYHEDWVFSQALSYGIGLHHGNIPRSLAQLCVSLFNKGKINILLCTSTLIEGVNTQARCMVIIDNKIAQKKYDRFTFNNIKGRSGRMFAHYIGHVYLFNPPPQDELLEVDFPIITQNDDSKKDILIQIEDIDLSQQAKERLRYLHAQEILPFEIIKKNEGIDPDDQLKLAKKLWTINEDELKNYLWNKDPDWLQLCSICELMHKFFVKKRQQLYKTPAQLAFYIKSLRIYDSIPKQISKILSDEKSKIKTVDEAINFVLSFKRRWASHDFPRFLRAISNIQDYVFMSRFGKSGDYYGFASKVENFFISPIILELDEHGIPIELSIKIFKSSNSDLTIDSALEKLSKINTKKSGLHIFERYMIYRYNNPDYI